MQTLCSALSLFGLSCRSQADLELATSFHSHLAEFGLSYGTDDEYKFRFELFKEADARIKATNLRNASFKVGHNQFSTYTDREYQAMLGRKVALVDQPEEVLDTSKVPKSVDWRDEGAVNYIQQQLHCTSGWAFASVAAMEAYHFKKSGKLLKLSEQQIIDCDVQSDGCNMGSDVYAYEYAKNSGLELADDYSYVAVTGTCLSVATKELVRATDYKKVQKKSVEQIKAAIAISPVTVSVYSLNEDFKYYLNGIFDIEDCGDTKYNLDHILAVVGYGKDKATKREFLILRNSWGIGWGEGGYMRMAVDSDGTGVCGVLREVYRPITN